MLRLTLWIAINMHPDGIACMGPDCSSWGVPARGTSMRSAINIFGNLMSSWVRRSTTMVTRLLPMHLKTNKWYQVQRKIIILPNLPILRLVLLLLVLMANNCIWVLEQPRQSLLGSHRRFSWMINHVAYVACQHTAQKILSYSSWLYKICFHRYDEVPDSPGYIYIYIFAISKVHQSTFWMMLHGHPSPKPTIVWSNMMEIQLLDLGCLRKSEREKRTILQTTRS